MVNAAAVVPIAGTPVTGSLPLTANSKIDKQALTALAGQLGAVEDNYDAPKTSTERRLAAGWAKVLGIPQEQIGRNDHFFDRGGTSLAAVKLASATGGVIIDSTQ